jgi:hypothetical protein
MLRELAAIFPGGPNALVQSHPSELTALLELAWQLRPTALGTDLGHPDRRSDLDGLPVSGLIGPAAAVIASPSLTLADYLRRILVVPVSWHHLIYAYMIENTRIYEIFRRILHEFLHGEKLGSLTTASQRWLRNTEELFYRDPPPFSFTSVSSHIRQDLRASRRNAYQRMFGMDLNHGNDDGKPYPYVRADAANNEFVATFEELLRELWIGRTNFAVTIGPRPIDDVKIANLVTRLHDMLRSRRLYGTLSREEFAFVSMMSWFHMTVEFDLPIIQDLKAEAASAGPEQRLFKIAQRVGLPAHGLSKSYFDIAEPISLVLNAIETGNYNTAATVPLLYTPPPPPPPPLGVISPQPFVMETITHWSIISGRDMKAGKVAPTSATVRA